MRPLRAVPSSTLIYSLIFSACSAATLGRSDDNTADKRRSHRNHRKPPSSDGRIKAGEEFNDGVHLELAPSCGVLSANSWDIDINAGIEWHKMETVVSFGDSYSQVGNSGDGSPPAPLRFVGKNPSAGGRNTNGETWIEQLMYFEDSEEHPRRLFSYARSGSTTDREVWPSRRWADDFPSQLSRFYANNAKFQLNPATTVYVGHFGFNDFWSIDADGNQMERAGNRAVSLLRDLHENAGAINILWLGVQFDKPSAGNYNRAVWNGLRHLHHDTKSTGVNQTVNFTFVDSSRFFSAIHEYYPKFGYTSSKHCLEGQQASIEDECEDPERTVYYMGAHPSRQTHYILAEYVASVLTRCWTSDNKQAYESLSHHGSALYYQLNGYLPFSLTTTHIFIFAFLALALCAYRPVTRLSRRGGLGALALMSPQ